VSGGESAERLRQRLERLEKILLDNSQQ